MNFDEIKPMTKLEIAKLLNVDINDITGWAQSNTFGDWLGSCPGPIDKIHDRYDVLMFKIINDFNQQIGKGSSFIQQVDLIKRELFSSSEACFIKEMRGTERVKPQNARWSIVGSNCLKYDYEWLENLQPFINNIASFGCWASDPDAGTCSEPYALLWTLEAEKIVAIDKEKEYIQNAQLWLEKTRNQHSYFRNYNLMFTVGDMTQKGLTKTTDLLEENSFDLSYCRNVLYNMYHSQTDLQAAIDTMASVVKPGGFVIAVEPKIGLDYTPKRCELFADCNLDIPIPSGTHQDISHQFEAMGLDKFNLDNAPEYSYCYQKPLDS